jgi:hypothetical protein
VNIVVTGGAVAVETVDAQCPIGYDGIEIVDRAVAFAARDGRVIACEKLATLSMDVFVNLEGLGAVAAFAAVAELTVVDVAVARPAGATHPVEAHCTTLSRRKDSDLPFVTRDALDRRMFSGEQKSGF